MEITKEKLFSIIIIFIMIFIGGFISNSISDMITEKNQKYLSSVHIDNDREQFEYGMMTNFGKALVYGEVEAIDPVSFEEINGTYLSIKKIREEYNMHTRVVTTTDGKGHTRSRTEVYYSWDTEFVDTKTVDEVYFLGNKFDEDEFDFDNYEILNPSELSDYPSSETTSEYLYTSSTVRYIFKAIPKTFNGTAFTVLKNNTINEVVFEPDTTINEFLDHSLKSDGKYIIIFWILWLILTALFVVGFVSFDNYWLDD